MDPTWPHLQIVYEFLLRYVVCQDTDPKIAKKCRPRRPPRPAPALAPLLLTLRVLLSLVWHAARPILFFPDIRCSTDRALWTHKREGSLLRRHTSASVGGAHLIHPRLWRSRVRGHVRASALRYEPTTRRRPDRDGTVCRRPAHQTRCARLCRAQRCEAAAARAIGLRCAGT